MISLLAFIRTGRLGEVGLGSTRTDVEMAFGPPDHWDTRFRFSIAPAWTYGDVKFLFYIDFIVTISITCHLRMRGGGELSFDPWIFDQMLCVEKTMTLLDEKNIGFYENQVDVTRGRVDLCLSSGVRLCFSERAESQVEMILVHG